ncbi:MAG: hypothetical protein GF383_01175 [Candidatus Lokiarchaeota archaeon]|nr:hypothetical protein [Candidatus Lokiarchaeota archaeon]MBD3337861.1 hypothetical protein [Candidatus Lokiarchaeota archaeon]
MKNLSPSELYESFEKKEITKNELIRSLLVICDYSKSEDSRIECLMVLSKIEPHDEKQFNRLEEFAISDRSQKVRLKAIELIMNLFPKKGLTLIKYVIENSKDREFLIRVMKKAGDSIDYSNEQISSSFLILIKPIIKSIFETADIVDFALLWDSWFYNIPKDYWSFINHLRNPSGILEILDGIITHSEIYTWFFEIIIKMVKIDLWLIFMNHIKCTARLTYIMIYIEEKFKLLEYIKFITFFNNKAGELNVQHREIILDIVKRGDLYSISILTLFGWLEYLEYEKINKLLQSRGLNLIKKLRALLDYNKIAFLYHPCFIQTLIPVLLKINQVDEKHLIHFLIEMKFEIQQKFLSELFKLIFSNTKSNNDLIANYYKRIRLKTCKILKIFSEYYDFSKLDLKKLRRTSKSIID